MCSRRFSKTPGVLENRLEKKSKSRVSFKMQSMPSRHLSRRSFIFQDTLSRHTIKTPFKTDAKKFTRHRQESKYVFKTLCKIFKTLPKASWKSIKCLDVVSWKYVRCLENQKVCILKTPLYVLKGYLDIQLMRLEKSTTIRLEKILKRLEKSFFFQDTFQDTLQDASIKTLLMTSWNIVGILKNRLDLYP